MERPILRLCDIHTFYGESHVLQGVSLDVNQGECVSLLGSNGMGKTTIMSTIMGITPAKSGSIFLEDKEITHCPPWEIARRGIGFVPEDRGIFDALTVLENIKIPYLNVRKRMQKAWKEELDSIQSLFPSLRGRENQLAGSLSGGEQQMVTVARGLITGSKMLLLDEPFKGLAPSIIQSINQIIRKLKTMGKTILIVEEKLSIAYEFSDRFYFLKKGVITGEEKIHSIRDNPHLFSKYLGIKDHAFQRIGLKEK